MQNKKKVFVSSRSFGSLNEQPIKLIEYIADVDKSNLGRRLSEAELINILPNYDAIIVGADEITRSVIESSVRLRVIAKHGAGLDNIDMKAATDRSIIVTYVPSVNAESVADFTFCLLLALLRKIVSAHISVKSGNWESRKFIGTELSGKTLGIIGMGSIGAKVARRALGFGMRIICFTANPGKHNEEAQKYNIEFVDITTLLKESDIVSIHCALTPETHGMLGEKELGLMKKSAMLVNTARGAIVDEKALYKALKNQWIAGAACDVFDKEPPEPSYPLFSLGNVVVAPHIASYTTEALLRIDLVLAEDLVRFLKGEKPKFIANPEVLTKMEARSP